MEPVAHTTAEERLRRLRAMMLVRTFERALLAQKNPGFQLLSLGEEAVAVGVCAALGRTDQLLCSGRSIAPSLARGVPPGGLLAELLGRDGGPNRGHAGRGHVSMPSIGFFGAHAVVGGNLTVAAGVALAQQQLKTGAVALVLFGDGALGAGSLHETMNLAALWRLPLVLVCSNNGYAVSTRVQDAVAAKTLSELGEPFGLGTHEADGAEVDAVADTVQRAVDAARAGQGPQLVILECARLGPHSTLTREERPAELMNALKAKDPIALVVAKLRAEGLLDDARLTQLQSEVDAEIAAAVQFAQSAPWP
ncbi:MAG: thiamine pyrophosphate-dependent dehydrogenase E1 component subunit alpha, partial [Deltaproteobacteria bacterium]|nr:thiamine pyrophosphate-dependent dehydrogenase E1 component subunit alpha [Deltaproteobacteria bacterium]